MRTQLLSTILPIVDTEEITPYMAVATGDKVPVVRGSALLALEGDPKEEASIRKLLEAMDEYIPDPIANKPFLMLVEHVESIQGQGVRVTGLLLFNVPLDCGDS